MQMLKVSEFITNLLNYTYFSNLFFFYLCANFLFYLFLLFHRTTVDPRYEQESIFVKKKLRAELVKSDLT
jgi:hypothetical protein